VVLVLSDGEYALVIKYLLFLKVIKVIRFATSYSLMTTTLIFSLPSNLKFEFGWYLVEFVLLTESLWLYNFYADFFSNFPGLIYVKH